MTYFERKLTDIHDIFVINSSSNPQSICAKTSEPMIINYLIDNTVHQVIAAQTGHPGIDGDVTPPLVRSVHALYFVCHCIAGLRNSY